MDIDAAKRAGKTPVSCYRCRKVGHISRECPTGFNIRHLTRDDIEVLMEQLSTQLDMMNVAARSEQLSEEPEESGHLSEEDFPKGSR